MFGVLKKLFCGIFSAIIDFITYQADEEAPKTMPGNVKEKMKEMSINPFWWKEEE